MSNVIYVTWQDANRGEDVQLKIDSCHSITVRVMYSFMAPDSWQRTNKQTSWPELTERSRDILTACDWQTCQHRFIFDQCVIGRFLIQIRLTAVSKISTFMTWVVSLRASERPVSMSRLLRGFKSSQTCKHEELWYWEDQMNKCIATNKSSRKQRNVQQQKLHLLSLHFKKTFYSFSRNNSWFQAYQKEATKTEQVSAFNQWISTEATLCQTHFMPTKLQNTEANMGVDLPTTLKSLHNTNWFQGFSAGGAFPACRAPPVTPTSCLGTFQINFPQITSRINLRGQATWGTRSLQ